VLEQFLNYNQHREFCERNVQTATGIEREEWKVIQVKSVYCTFKVPLGNADYSLKNANRHENRDETREAFTK